MKIIYSDYKAGKITIKTETIDDLWYLNNIVNVNDEIEGITFRKIVVGNKEGERKKTFLRIKVEKKEFREFSNILKFLGKIISCKDDNIPIGDYHSFNIDENSKLTIIKKSFSKVDKDYLRKSLKRNNSNLLIVSCDYGDALFAYVHSYGLQYGTKLSQEIGGKKELAHYEKNKQSYLKLLLKTINDIAKNKKIDKILIGGASMINDNLKKMIKEYDYIKDKTLFEKVNYPGKNGIKELIYKGIVDKLSKDNEYSKQVNLVNKILKEIGKGALADYGKKQVSNYIKNNNVKELVITDLFFQNNKKWINELVKILEKNKGNFFIIPSNSEHGKEIDALSGIACTLRYKY